MTHTFKPGDVVRVVRESEFAAKVGDVVTIVDGPDAGGDYSIRNHNNEDSVYVEASCIEPVADTEVYATPNEPVIPVFRVIAAIERFCAALGITVETIPARRQITFKETF
jgi:hypothetical protein